MTEINVNTTANRIIIPPKPWDEGRRRKILESLKSISEEDIKNALAEAERLKKKKLQIEAEKKEQEENKPEITPELKKFRERWEREMLLDKITKNKIIQAVEEIPLEEKFDGDGNKITSFSMWWKLYHVLNVSNLDKISDNKYNVERFYDLVKKKVVKFWWMRWDDSILWKNKKLAKYVQNQEKKWFNIPTIDLMKEILGELWRKADLHKESDQIAMRMYLMGVNWTYWLTMYYSVPRYTIICAYDDRKRMFDSCYYDDSFASLFLVGKH